MAHPGLAWICSRCCRERTEERHVCKTDGDRLAELRKATGALVKTILAHKVEPSVSTAVRRVQRLLKDEG